ncbi:TPA: hypothetical protein MM072_005374 [Klebsiella pneumoniae]|uniref:hypothetical protein n=1 Tax=Klebsiella pneumoniae TaxID=573 RepID=UPI0029E8B566|nr:hypothetical protein [Klebsiella pneumoniae]HEO1538334.1 hypothetical protein [Klebsiella aerogenes]HBW7283415.1 hypothetical protein [Klebsiella pneumoniae]HBW7975150.1 hypothetical protein [Klebsiella pneumoniae]HBW8672615.1 hypothetical protein [Klebsiella pneumoniae]
MPEDNFESPFDGLIYMSWAVAVVAILVALYLLARVVVTIKLITAYGENYSFADLRTFRLQIKMHVIFSAVTFALGAYLLYLNLSL